MLETANEHGERYGSVPPVERYYIVPLRSTVVSMKTTDSATGAARLRPHLTDAVLGAALDQLQECGYERLSMEQVAKRAGVGKAALYRRWPNKLAMVIDALARLSAPLPELEQQVSLKQTVRAMVQDVRDWLISPPLNVVLPELIAQSARHPQLAAALKEQIAGPRRELADRALRRWTAPGQSGEQARSFAIDLLAAPIFWRLAQQREVNKAYLERLTNLIVDVIVQG